MARNWRRAAVSKTTYILVKKFMIKIAACQYQIEKLSDWDSYATKINTLVTRAKQEGADLLLLPEYAGIEIACAHYATDKELYEGLQPLLKKYIEFYKGLARHHHIYLQPGTIIEKIAPDRYINRAYFFSPEGIHNYQDKLQLTEYEKSLNILAPGEQVKLFETSLGKIGIAICYDSEFPEIVSALTRAGALLILVPSYTTTLAGYHRVFLSCRARAIENQCYVAVSYAVNTVNLSAEAEETFGCAGILGPADTGFPDDGILAQGTMNQVEIATASLSFNKINSIRRHGQVHNFVDRKSSQKIPVNTIEMEI
jgi:predicted amidohydrolase